MSPYNFPAFGRGFDKRGELGWMQEVDRAQTQEKSDYIMCRDCLATHPYPWRAVLHGDRVCMEMQHTSGCFGMPIGRADV